MALTLLAIGLLSIVGIVLWATLNFFGAFGLIVLITLAVIAAGLTLVIACEEVGVPFKHS